MFVSVCQVVTMGVVGVGAIIYFGLLELVREIEEVSGVFVEVYRQGLFMVLWRGFRYWSFTVLRQGEALLGCEQRGSYQEAVEAAERCARGQR
jgi:DhnA family fructose-bisphosphate aldolase class Ia